MYPEYNTYTRTNARSASEIDLEVREMERKLALMYYRDQNHTPNKFAEGLRRTFKRVTALLAALF